VRKSVLLPVPMLHACGAEILSKEVEVIDGSELSPEDARDAMARTHGIYSVPGLPDGMSVQSDEQMQRAPALEVIGGGGSGYEWIDVDAATRRGIAVVYAAGGQYAAVAEHAIGLMLSLAKRIGQSDRALHRDKTFLSRDVYTGDGWPGFPHEIDSRTLGVLGYGFVGRELARKCRAAFDMQVLAYDPYYDAIEAERHGVTLYRQRRELDAMLSRCDYVALALPLSEESHHLIGEAELRAMKPSAHLINVSRGGTVDERALIRALEEGWIAGAGLDVFDPEPTADGHPFFEMDNVVVTPHIAGWVEEALPRLAATTAREMLSVLRGEKPNRLANPRVWSDRQ
jgi:D-3-phosphoglycerate dehydrogenase